MSSIKDILSQFDFKKINSRTKKLQEWQSWCFTFCDRYGIHETKSVRSVLSIASKHRNHLQFLKRLEAWISDYPNLSGDPVRLFLWKYKQEINRNPRILQNLYVPDKTNKTYKIIRNDIKWYIVRKSIAHSSKLDAITAYCHYRLKLSSVAKQRGRDSLALQHLQIISFVIEHKDRFLKARLLS